MKSNISQVKLTTHAQLVPMYAAPTSWMGFFLGVHMLDPCR